MSRAALLLACGGVWAMGTLPLAAQEADETAKEPSSLQVVASPEEAAFYKELQRTTLPKLNALLNKFSDTSGTHYPPGTADWVIVQRALARALETWTSQQSGGSARIMAWRITVLGEVANPTCLEHGDGLKPANMVHAIAKCGGWTKTAALDKVTIIRPVATEGAEPGYEIIPVNLKAFIEKGDPAGNPTINNGDTIVVGEKVF